MPAIYFAKRFWKLGSDDFVFAGIADILFRACCLILIGVPFAWHNSIHNCIPNLASEVLFYLIFAINGVTMLLLCLLSILSSRGGIMQLEKRKAVPHILAMILIMAVLELGVHSANIYFATTFLASCNFAVYVCFLAGNCLRLIQNVFYSIWFLAKFQRSGDYWGRVVYNGSSPQRATFLCPQSTQSTLQRGAYEEFGKSMQKRLNRWGRLRTQKRNRDTVDGVAEESHAIEAAAKMFSAIFYDADLVTSDIIAGLFLLRWQTKQWTSFGRKTPLSVVHRLTKSAKLDPLSTGNEPAVDGDAMPAFETLPDSHWLSVKRLSRMAAISASIYGKLFYMFEHLCNPKKMTALCRHMSCTSSKKCVGCCLCGDDLDAQPFEIGCCCCTDNNADCAAILEVSGLKREDFVTLRFENAVYKSPYFIAFDHETKTVVVCIRGTLSFEDALVDLICDGERLNELEDFYAKQNPTATKPCFLAHRGMVSTSRRLLQTLLADGHLQNALAQKPHYSLVVTGHSLGAGITSILTLLMRPMYPDVKGYAMSCPLGLMNEELANYSRPCLLSVVYGFDVFAHMSFRTSTDLKWRLVDALHATNIPKYRLLRHGFDLSMCGGASACCTPSRRTVGSDGRLLDEKAQNRLMHPSYRMLVGGGATANTDGDGGESQLPSTSSTPAQDSSSTSNDRRYLSGERCVASWLDPEMKHNWFPWPDPTFKSACAPPTGNDDAALPDFADAQFGGLVLHLVDVELDIEQTDSHRAKKSPSSNSSPPDQPENPLITADRSVKERRRRGCCKSSNDQLSTMAIWSNADQFKSILVHPRMLADHLPSELVPAVNRWVKAITANPGQEETKVSPHLMIRQVTKNS